MKLWSPPLVVFVLLLAACDRSQPEAHHHEGAHEEAAHEEAAPAKAPAKGPATAQPDGSRLYGRALSDRATTPLSQILQEPARFSGSVVRTQGEIAQVCQRMGCWMELRDGSHSVRVPMAGHSFFLPREVAGRPATLEGTVNVRELDQATREHLAEEGATVLASNVEIEATGVVVR
jgi:hypothetical protein